jgi:hypothetical protein
MKKVSRKMSLNRETLAQLQSVDLAIVHGGLASSFNHCDGCIPVPTRPTSVVLCKR